MGDNDTGGCRRRLRARPRPRTAPACVPLRSRDMAAVVDAAIAGEQWAWTALVTAFRPAVAAVARRHGLSAADQDDVAQRTWLLLFRHIGCIETPAAIAGWVTTTARRESLRILDARRRETPVEPQELPEGADDAGPEAAIVAHERREALERALEGVSARQRALLRLMMTRPAASYEQIAEALGIPVGSIGPTRARGIERLRSDAHLARVVAGRTTVATEDDA